MADTGQGTPARTTPYLRRHPEEYQRLVSSFLIKVTDFFRDPDLFDAPARADPPRAGRGGALARRRAAALVGRLRHRRGGVLAGDPGRRRARRRARARSRSASSPPTSTPTPSPSPAAARYPASALGARPARAARALLHCRSTAATRSRRSIRRLVVFGQHDLGQRAPFPRIDLALCRNVLIYFTPELQRRALQLFAFALRQGGRLVLGKSETTSPLPEHFTVEDPRLKVYRRRGDRVLIPPADSRGAVPWSELATAAADRPDAGRAPSADAGPAPAAHARRDGRSAPARPADWRGRGGPSLRRPGHQRRRAGGY